MDDRSVKKGFTIIELLMVITIIGILLGITVTATTGAIRRAREEKAHACVLVVNQGLAVYYAQKGRWPDPIGSRVDSNNPIQTDNGGQAEYYTLEADEVRQVVKTLVLMARDGNPVMDVSGLYVSRHNGEGANDYGMDFLSAIRGTKKSGLKMTTSEMYYGYPDANTGHFKRLRAYYYPRTDRLVFTDPYSSNSSSEL